MDITRAYKTTARWRKHLLMLPLDGCLIFRLKSCHFHHSWLNKTSCLGGIKNI